jgi:hypothetical protein
MSKVLPAGAKWQGTHADAILKQARTMLDGMRAGQSEATLAAFDALGSYLDDYKHPKGPLKITVNPPNKASAAALSDIKSPDDAVKALGLDRARRVSERYHAASGSIPSCAAATPIAKPIAAAVAINSTQPPTTETEPIFRARHLPCANC